MVTESKSFSDMAETPTGRALKYFLTSDEVIIRLETATLLRRPALEGIPPEMFEQFGPDIKLPRWKQFIGWATKEVMANRNYKVDRTGVQIRVEKSIFTTASRYSKDKD